MKTRTLTLLGIATSAVLLANPLFAQTAVTTAVGYRTEPIGVGFNLLSSNLSNAVDAAGDFDSAGFLTDDDVDFTSLLTGGTPYTVKLLSGNYPSATVTGWDATSLTTDPDISGAVAQGDSYEIRATDTIESLFGATPGDLNQGTETTADVVWVPTDPGSFSRVYYNDQTVPNPIPNFPPILTPGWRAIGGGDTDASGTQIPFNNSYFIQRQTGGPSDIVFTGHVQNSDSSIDVGGGVFNAVSRVLPVGVSVTETGLPAFVQQGDEANADIVWNPTGPSSYDRLYLNDTTVPNPIPNFPPILTPGWRVIGGGDTDRSGDIVNSGYLIQVRGPFGVLLIPIPPGVDVSQNQNP